MIISKRHCGELAELTREEWNDFGEVVEKMENALKRAFGAVMFNWTAMMNDAFLKPNPNPHVHWHFRPRYDKDVKVGEYTFKDPQFGHHYDRERSDTVSEDIVREIIAKIRANI